MAVMLIRSEEQGDLPAIRELVAEAFGQVDEADLAHQLRDDGDAVVSAVAEEHGMIIGHAMLSRMTAPFRALGLAPVAVRPSWQRKGVGTALIRWALARAGQDGWQGVFVLGDPSFYRRFGFDPALARDFACRYAGPHFMALALCGALPAYTGAVEYARAFNALL